MEVEDNFIVVDVSPLEERGRRGEGVAPVMAGGVEVGREMKEGSPFEGEWEGAVGTGEEGRGGEREAVGAGREGERERALTYDIREMADTLSPLLENTLPKKPTSPRRESTSSIKREKPHPLMRSEPLYILRINVRGMTILPNIQANEISIRAGVGQVKLTELKASDRKNQTERVKREAETDWGGTPVIRARIEVGSQVQRFNLPPSSINDKEQDTVVMLSISGLTAAVLVKNAPILKDFFDDEYEVDAPVPIQIRFEDTSLILRECLDHTPNTDSTMNVVIKSVEIHRGPKIEGTNLFPSKSEASSNDEHVEMETLRLNPSELASLREVSPATDSTDSAASAGNNQELVQTFRSFIDAFESHVRRHGGIKVQLNQPQHIAGLLQELQVSLSEERNSENLTSSDAPPSYSESIQHTEASTLTGGDSQQRGPSGESTLSKTQKLELRKLKVDPQELTRLQAENSDLIQQLMQTKVLLAERSQDLDEVTSECKKAKDELVTHKQVLENYQEHIERLLSENADLKGRTMSPK